jgi:SAM-dependent methyltransferase
VTGKELRELFFVSGRKLTDAAYGRITREFRIILFECRECGFQFFDPDLAGTGEFYSELEQVPYYPAERPEFDTALDFCRKRGLKSVLDVGGGDGAFLDLAREWNFEAVGIELNPKAAAVARAKGHRMLEKSLSMIDPSELNGGVEFMSFFQVVEHLTNPKQFLSEASRLVKPGGYMMFSVPNRQGIFRLLPYDPANLPPHHVSRWRRADLAKLSKSCGLDVLQIGTDTLFGRGIEDFWNLNNQFARAIGRPTYPGGTWLPKLLSFLYRKLGCKYYLPKMGLSIYAIVQRPN